MKLIILITSLLVSASSSAAAGYAEKIKALDVSTDRTPALEYSDRLYVVQTRAVNLTERWEVKVSAGQIFSGDDFLWTQQFGLGTQYHFNDDWSVGGGWAKVENEFTEPAENLLSLYGRLPDVDYAKSRLEAFVEYNLFYGKIRLTKDAIFYFDNYIGLGLASHDLNSGNEVGPLGRAGFVFWFTPASLRLGVTDYYYKETSLLASKAHHNVQGQIELGYVF